MKDGDLYTILFLNFYIDSTHAIMVLTYLGKKGINEWERESTLCTITTKVKMAKKE